MLSTSGLIASIRKLHYVIESLCCESPVASCSLLTALILQLNGLVITYKLLESKRNIALGAYLCTRKNNLQRKKKLARQRLLNRKSRSLWVEKGRTDLWWQNMIGPDVPETCWKRNFRMTKGCFLELAAIIDTVVSPQSNCPNYRFLTTHKKLAITIYYLKDTGSLWMTANVFGIHQCTVSKTVKVVCDAINNIVGPIYLHLPKNKEDMTKLASQFEVKFGMIQAFGCIDGTHVQIKRPIKNGQDYFCYKQYFSLNVQALCDSKGYFIDVECKWPGSVHDAKMFTNSTINKKLIKGTLPQTLYSLPNYHSIPNYLIGDPAYPLTNFCIKEFQSCSNNEEVIFNSMLRSARNQIECAFGRLKARWGFLRKIIDIKIETVPIVIYTCFVLHNFCEKNKTYDLNEEEVNQQIERHRSDALKSPNLPDSIYSANNPEGKCEILFYG
nr:uncharacterized protein LOC124816319 [Hydra vulgaris]